MSSESSRFRVAICGGGISGLTLAVTLCQYSEIPVEVYESASEIRSLGTGISFWKRTWDVMCRLGLDSEMDKRSIRRPSEGERIGLIIRRSDQLEEGKEIKRVVSSYSTMPLHRTELVNMLLSRLTESCTIHTSKTLTSYSQNPNGSYTLHFGDGSTAETDILIGADGVRSVVRRVLFEGLAQRGQLPSTLIAPNAIHKIIEPQWSGTMVYRSVIQADKLRAIYPDHPVLTSTPALSYSGKGRHIIAFPFAQETLLNFLAYDTDLNGHGKKFEGKWVSDAPKAEVLELFKDWEPHVQAILESLDDVTSRWAIHVCSALPVCVSDNVALIGDAVHAMTPHAAAGAGQAIEDAYILGRLLADDLTSKKAVPSALKIYQDIRLNTANEIVEISRDLGLMYEFNGPEYDGVDRNDEEAIRRWGEVIDEKWRFQWSGVPEDDWQRARVRLQGVLEDVPADEVDMT